jgi:glycosyltransferase involved in cell wall biosynthesis
MPVPGFRINEEGLGVTPTVSVVVLAKNVARNLAQVFASIPSWVDEVVLVDRHSLDDTAAEAELLMPDVHVVSQRGHGRGDARREGYSVCRGDIVVMLDANGSTDGREIPHLVSELVAGADFASGPRSRVAGMWRHHGYATPGEADPERPGEPAVRHSAHRSLLRLRRLLGAPRARS